MRKDGKAGEKEKIRKWKKKGKMKNNITVSLRLLEKLQ